MESEESEELGVDVDGDGVVDFAPGDVGVVSREVSWTEAMEHKRVMLRHNLRLAQISQYQIGKSRIENLAALEMVTQVELALIAYFGESVPEAGVDWDGERRAREIERRLVQSG